MNLESVVSKPTLDVLSIFPELCRSVLDSSILRRAQVQGQMNLESTDLRSYAEGRYKQVDDTPYGGKQGMLFRPEVLEKALEQQLAWVGGDRSALKVVYTSPRGIRLEQPVAEAMADWLGSRPGQRLTIVCGRYEGVDERFIEKWVDLELSLGDFILSGGELPGLVLADSIVRLMPGVLGDSRSAREDSFSNGLLEYPQYTKPREFNGLSVPSELVNGVHKDIDEWNLRQSLLLTFAYRPDLIRVHTGQGLPQWARQLLGQLKKRMDLRGD